MIESQIIEIEGSLKSPSYADVPRSSCRASYPDVEFLSTFSLSDCMKFHESADTAHYVLDELVAMSDPHLDVNIAAFVFLLSESISPVEEAAFAACFDFFMDIVIRNSSLDHPRGNGESLDVREKLAREFLIQAVAARRPSVKLQKMEHSLRILSERSDATNADDLLLSLARILPSVPLIRETVTLMRTYIDIRGDSTTLFGPIGYALTSIETALGTL